VISTGFMANDIATSLALSPDEADVVVTGDISGGATWITAAYSSITGTRKWLVTAPEGIAARDVVVDATRVYVTGQGNVGITGFLTVVAYDRASGARLWRTDKKPADGNNGAGLRMDGARRKPGRDGSGLTRVPRLVHGGLRDHRSGPVGGGPGWRFEHRRDPRRCAGDGRRHHRGHGPRGSQSSRRVHPGRHGRIWSERDPALGGVLENGDELGHGPSQWRPVRIGRLRRLHHLLAGRGSGDGGHVRDPLDRHGAPERDLRRFRVQHPPRNRDVVGVVFRGWRLRHGASDDPPVRDSRDLHGVPDGHR
jgi:hypothetical protein